MSISLLGKIAVITVESSSAGLATAKRFAEEGASVFIFGRRQTEIGEPIAKIGGEVFAAGGDVSKQAMRIAVRSRLARTL